MISVRVISSLVHNCTIDASCIPENGLTFWTRDRTVVNGNLTHLFTLQTNTRFTSALTAMSDEFGDNIEADEGNKGEGEGEHGLHAVTVASDDFSSIKSDGVATASFLPLPIASDSSILLKVYEYGRSRARKAEIPQRGK
jgi:hypothetical protein